MKKRLLATAIGLSATLGACSQDAPDSATTMATTPATNTVAAPLTGDPATMANPFFTPSSLPYGLPPFDQIRPEHFIPAYERAMRINLQEVNTITANPDSPNFDNTILALERSGDDLRRVSRVFGNLNGADTNPELQAIQREMSPRP